MGICAGKETTASDSVHKLAIVTLSFIWILYIEFIIQPKTS